MTADSDTQAAWPAQYDASDEIGDVQGGHVDASQLLAAAFLGAFAKDMSSAAGKASAEAVREAAKRLREHLRERAGESGRIVIDGEEDGRLLAVENLSSIPVAALEELMRMELPPGPGRLTWVGGRWRWRSGKGGGDRRG